MKESMVTDRLAATARTAMIDIVTILLGFAVGASTQAKTFLQPSSLLIFGLGALSFAVATAGGVLFAKFMNLFLHEKINPLGWGSRCFGGTGFSPSGTNGRTGGRSSQLSC